MTILPPVTDALARFVAETDFSMIYRRSFANAKLYMLDTLGVALAAITTPVAVIAIDYWVAPCRAVSSRSTR